MSSTCCFIMTSVQMNGRSLVQTVTLSCDLDSFNQWLFDKGEPTWAAWTPTQSTSGLQPIEATATAHVLENGANETGAEERHQRWQ